jgi:hypothetical protein
MAIARWHPRQTYTKQEEWLMRRLGCISNFWSSGGELSLRIPIRRPGLFHKHTA